MIQANVTDAAFNETEAGLKFIASAASRETAVELMTAFAFFARSEAEAEMLWNGDGFGTICHLSDVIENATGNGLREAADLQWGSKNLQQIVDSGDFA